MGFILFSAAQKKIPVDCYNTEDNIRRLTYLKFWTVTKYSDFNQKSFLPCDPTSHLLHPPPPPLAENKKPQEKQQQENQTKPHVQKQTCNNQIKWSKHWPFSQPTSETSTTAGLVLNEGNAEL